MHFFIILWFSDLVDRHFSPLAASSRQSPQALIDLLNQTCFFAFQMLPPNVDAGSKPVEIRFKASTSQHQ